MRYCIGDIHGCVKTLEELIAQILQKDTSPEFYFVGDLIDRGPSSKNVIDLLIFLEKEGFPIKSVKGNHEEMFLKTYSSNFPIASTNWYYNGAESTIRSFTKFYDINKAIKNYIPQSYYDYINSMPYFIELDDYIIVHAGFNFSTQAPFTDFDFMLWARVEDNNHAFTNGRKIIHGHTPASKDKLQERILNSAADVYNVDSGCVYVKRPQLGYLTALNLDTLELLHVKNLDTKA